MYCVKIHFFTLTDDIIIKIRNTYTILIKIITRITNNNNDILLGFIGKGMTRHLNRLWNYGVKGLLGTLIILFVFPVVCIMASVGSLVIALTAVLWLVSRAVTFYLL